jgi:hypothetical protein
MATTRPSACRPPDLGHLAVGQHVGHHAAMPAGARDRLGGAPVVAGEHHDVEPHRAQPRDGRAPTSP